MNERLLGRRHEIVSTVLFLAQHRGEKLDQRPPPDGAILVIPGSVAPDSEADIPALLRRHAILEHGFAAALAKDLQNALFVLLSHLEPVVAIPYLSAERGFKHYCDQFLTQRFPLPRAFRTIVGLPDPFRAKRDPLPHLPPRKLSFSTGSTRSGPKSTMCARRRRRIFSVKNASSILR